MTGKSWGILVPPVGEALQCCCDSTFIGSSVNLLQVDHQFLQILVDHVFAGVSELVDDAVLYLCLGKYRLYGSGKAREVIGAGNEYIFHTTVAHAV